jgi:hypothetical protein
MARAEGEVTESLEVPDRGRDEVLRVLDRNAPLARVLI